MPRCWPEGEVVVHSFHFQKPCIMSLHGISWNWGVLVGVQYFWCLSSRHVGWLMSNLSRAAVPWRTCFPNFVSPLHFSNVAMVKVCQKSYWNGLDSTQAVSDPPSGVCYSNLLGGVLGIGNLQFYETTHSVRFHVLSEEVRELSVFLGAFAVYKY